MGRKPKYLQVESSGRERWLISYTDILTILLILFVAAAAQSFGVRPSTRTADPAPVPPKPESRQALVRAGQELERRGLEERLDKRGLVISLPQAILFPSGQDHVTPAAFPMLDQVASVLNSIPNKVTLVGHADSVPIHNRRFQNNWELSAARSVQLLELLATRYGVAESRLSVQSDGSYHPKSSNATEDGRAENRRVEILIQDETAP
jgi:chemotaxis protein MotB